MISEIEAYEFYFIGNRKGIKGRGVGSKTIVFGNLERSGKVAINAVKDLSAETLIKTQ